MNHFLIKGLLSLLIIGQAPVEPICVSIDRYQTPDEKFNLYLFGDIHVGHPQEIRQEHADFIKAAKEKNAFVLVEDKSYYDGNHSGTRLLIDQMGTAMNEAEKIIQSYTSLLNVARNCTDHSIPFFNVECRHELDYAEIMRNPFLYDRFKINLSLDVARLMLSIKYKNNNWLNNYYNGLRDQFDIQSMNDTPQIGQLEQLENFENMAIETRMLHGIYDLTVPESTSSWPPELIPFQQKNEWLKKQLDSSENAKNIFIFAGLSHIQQIIHLLEKHMHSIKNNPIKGYKTFPSNRYSILFDKDQDKEKYLKRTRVYNDYTESFEERLNQILAQKFINKYQVNISEFFSLENQAKQHPSFENTPKLTPNLDSTACKKLV